MCKIDIRKNIYRAMADLFDELDTTKPPPWPKNVKGGATIVARMTEAAHDAYQTWYKEKEKESFKGK